MRNWADVSKKDPLWWSDLVESENYEPKYVFDDIAEDELAELNTVAIPWCLIGRKPTWSFVDNIPIEKRTNESQTFQNASFPAKSNHGHR